MQNGGGIVFKHAITVAKKGESYDKLVQKQQEFNKLRALSLKAQAAESAAQTRLDAAKKANRENDCEATRKILEDANDAYDKAKYADSSTSNELLSVGDEIRSLQILLENSSDYINDADGQLEGQGMATGVAADVSSAGHTYETGKDTAIPDGNHGDQKKYSEAEIKEAEKHVEITETIYEEAVRIRNETIYKEAVRIRNEPIENPDNSEAEMNRAAAFATNAKNEFENARNILHSILNELVLTNTERKTFEGNKVKYTTTDISSHLHPIAKETKAEIVADAWNGNDRTKPILESAFLAAAMALSHHNTNKQPNNASAVRNHIENIHYYGGEIGKDSMDTLFERIHNKHQNMKKEECPLKYELLFSYDEEFSKVARAVELVMQKKNAPVPPQATAVNQTPPPTNTADPSTQTPPGTPA